CPQCHAELRDLSELAGSPPARAASRWLVAAAALLIALMAGAYWVSRSRRVVTPPPPPAAVAVTPAPDQWTQLAAAVLSAGRMDPPPILRELRPAPDVLRDPAATSAQPAMTPAGVVIESVTPTLHWTVAGGRSVVSVFDGRRRVARSEVLDTHEWRVSPPLARGRTYAWQIEVRRPESVDIVPAPPAPPALFHVLDEGSAAILAEARRRHRNDPLIIGVLHARMGMQTEAAGELRAWAAQHPREPNAAALAGSVARW
ncbi:MAG TPA: hypothetical protein VM733_03700, partial [Thermoanaerobaculia bacterium]|nr:hypothetical protein [Thermoanaerobaculia bacterium]